LKSITKKGGRKFNWMSETALSDREVFKLTIEGNSNIVEGLVSLADRKDHIFLHLIESAPFDFGKPKLYEGVPGNLVAFACKESKDRGYEGFVSFFSKTKLIENNMGCIKEPKGVDFVVEPHVLTVEVQKIMSKIIADYKATGKITRAPKTKEAQRKMVKKVNK